MLVLVAVMTYTTLVFLLRGSAATGATTYSQLARVTCGTPVMKVGFGEAIAFDGECIYGMSDACHSQVVLPFSSGVNKQSNQPPPP